MAKSQVEESKTAKKKPPFQHGNEGSIIEFTHQCAGGFAVALVRNETQQHSAALKSAGQNPAAYSHSFTLVCCCVIPVSFSWVIRLDRRATKSLHVSPCGRLGQSVRQRRKLFGHQRPAVSFLSRGQKQAGLQGADILAEGVNSLFVALPAPPLRFRQAPGIGAVLAPLVSLAR